MRKKKNLVGAADSAETSNSAASADSADASVVESVGVSGHVGASVSESSPVVAECVSADDPAAKAVVAVDLSRLTPHVKEASDMLFGAVNPF